MKDNILISIVTVCYNAQESISKTIESVLEQNGCKMEYIIVDGKSSDNTMDIINGYLLQFKEKDIPITVKSEADKGIFDAMNKGASWANGTWIIYMNAGDTFHKKDVINRISTVLKNSSSEIIFGDCRQYCQYCDRIRKPGKLENLKYEMALSHQSTFVRTNLMKKEKFNLKFKYAGDHDLLLRFYLQGRKFEYVQLIISDFVLDGVSTIRQINSFNDTIDVLRHNNVLGNNPKIRIKLEIERVKCLIKEILPVSLRWKLVNAKLAIFSNSQFQKNDMH